jgi:hypothetical protein
MSYKEGKNGVNNSVKWVLGIVGALLIGGLLVAGGILIGQQLAGQQALTARTYGPGMTAALSGGTGMMQWDDDGDDGDGDDYPYRMGPGMMGRGAGSGMMGRGGVGPGYMWDGGHMWDDDFDGDWPGYGMMGGAYQDEMHAAIADALGMSVEELEQAMWEDGKTIWQLADEQGISQDEFLAAMQDAHDSVLAQMVADGVISQEQADWMSEHMAEGPYGPGNCPGWQAGPSDGDGA